MVVVATATAVNIIARWILCSETISSGKLEEFFHRPTKIFRRKVQNVVD